MTLNVTCIHGIVTEMLAFLNVSMESSPLLFVLFPQHNIFIGACDMSGISYRTRPYTMSVAFGTAIGFIETTDSVCYSNSPTLVSRYVVSCFIILKPV